MKKQSTATHAALLRHLHHHSSHISTTCFFCCVFSAPHPGQYILVCRAHPTSFPNFIQSVVLIDTPPPFPIVLTLSKWSPSFPFMIFCWHNTIRNLYSSPLFFSLLLFPFCPLAAKLLLLHPFLLCLLCWSSCRISEHQDDWIPTQEQLADVPIFVHGLCLLLPFARLGCFLPHFPHRLQYHVHMPVKCFDVAQQLPVVPAHNQYLRVFFYWLCKHLHRPCVKFLLLCLFQLIHSHLWLWLYLHCSRP